MSERADEEPIASSKGERRRRSKRVRKSPGGAGRNGRWGFWAFAVLGSVFAAVTTYVLVIYPVSDGPGAGREVTLTIDEGASLGATVDQLAAAGLVASPRLFALYARLSSSRFAPGEHLLTDDAGPVELVHRLERRGAASKAKIVIPEGFTRFDIARRLRAAHVASEARFLEATEDPALLKELGLEGAPSAEGYLFPATYELSRDADPRDLVRRLKSEFERRFALLERDHRLARAGLESTLGWTRREIVILASLVEKEAALDEERPLVASVFLNRLRDRAFRRKVLQCDPTAGYGCLLHKDLPSCAGYSGKITPAMNADPKNPYSTYAHEGLPPGPIANPGARSLQAVLSPANTRFLYFVARGEGRRHTFSETVEEHNAAVKDYRDRQRQRAGGEP